MKKCSIYLIPYQAYIGTAHTGMMKPTKPFPILQLLIRPRQKQSPHLYGGDEIPDIVVEQLGGEEGMEIDLLQVAGYQLQRHREAVQPRAPILADVLLYF
jgi:hypothetical protein